MMHWIVGTSLKFRALVVAIAAGMLVLGSVSIGKMPVDAFPEFAPPRVEIQTICLGLSPEEVEGLVTVPLEDVLNGVPGLDQMRSKSVSQLSSIVLIFHPGTDLIKARQLVSERVATVAATLPTWAAPPFMIQPLSSTSRVMKIGLSSETRNMMELSMITYWTIRARLLGIEGVANVAMWGEQLQMLTVQVDPKRLAAHNVTLNAVMETTAASLDAGLLRFSSGSVIGTGGFVDTATQRLPIRNVPSITTPDHLAQVPVGTTPDGNPLRLGDVADVKYDHQPMIGDAVINSGPGLMLIVEKLPWGNSLDITREVEAALADLAPGMEGIEVDTTIFRPASFIETAVDNLTNALLIGCVLVILVLIAFLYEWRAALISIVSIPLSLVAAALVLYYRGATVNTMMLAGFVIAVGVVVDDAIIGIENITRRLRESRQAGSTKSTASIVLDASLEVRGPIVYATLIIVAAAGPIFFLQGLTGSFFKPLAISYTLAVLASLVVALTVTPALAQLLLRKSHIERRNPPLVRFLQKYYHRGLDRITKQPRWAYLAVAAIVAGGIAITPGLGQSLLPSFKERDFLMHFVLEPSASWPEMVRITRAAEAELKAIPGVRNSGSHIGQAFLMDEVVGVNFTEIWVSIEPNADYKKTHDEIERTINGYPGIRRDVQTYLKERTKEVLSGTGDSIVVRVFGENLDTLRTKADEVKKALGETPGVVDQHVSLQVPVPQIQIEVKLDIAEKYGIKPGDVRRAAAALFAGEEVGDNFNGGKAYDVWVIGTPQVRSSLTTIENALIDTPSGQRVRLADIAEVALRTTPNLIEHDRTSRRIDVGANVKDRDLGSAVEEVKEKLAKIQFPQGYHYELLGEYAERQKAQSQLLWLAVAALIVIFLLLQVSYDSWRLAMLSFLTLPSALVGGVLAVYFFGGGVVSLGSLVGFLTVLAIAARNGILLLNHYQHLEREEGMTFGKELVLKGSRDRLSPILMTTLATGLALVPLAVLGDRPGHEIEHPMAIVILGGLVTSTLLNLFLVPALYLRFGRGEAARAAQPTPDPTAPEASDATQPQTQTAVIVQPAMAAAGAAGATSPTKERTARSGPTARSGRRPRKDAPPPAS